MSWILTFTSHHFFLLASRFTQFKVMGQLPWKDGWQEKLALMNCCCYRCTKNKRQELLQVGTPSTIKYPRVKILLILRGFPWNSLFQISFAYCCHFEVQIENHCYQHLKCLYCSKHFHFCLHYNGMKKQADLTSNHNPVEIG